MKNLTPRKISLLLLAAFGLLIIAATLVAIRFVRDESRVYQIGHLREHLQTIGQEVAENLDAGYPDSFEFLEISARIQRENENYSYVLRDSSGMILSPSFVAGKQIKMENIRPLKHDGSAFVADIWGARCLVVIWPFPDRPLELLGIYDNSYIFDDVHLTTGAFLVLLSTVFAILLLLSWFWIIPALERMYARRDKAERELQNARTLQQKAVTQAFPLDPRFDVYAVLQPMKEVGGDIYRCGMLDGKLLFVIGDVSDKGTEAAFMMFLVIGFMRTRVKSGVDLGELMGEVNGLICDNPDFEMFCTLFLGCIDPDTMEMVYCNAGHTRTLVDGEFLDQDPQLIAGIQPGFRYHTQRLQLRPGARLLLYTDGVTEARNPERAFFGEERLQAWMRERPAAASCEEDCRSLLETLDAFRGSARQNDDIAIMSIRIR